MTDAFPLAKTFPKINKYQTRFSKDQGSMDNIRGDFFIYNDTLQQDINKTDKNINKQIQQIDKLENDNSKLMVEVQGLEDAREGAIGMYEDAQTMYNLKLLQNTIYLIALGGLGYGIYKSYKQSS